MPMFTHLTCWFSNNEIIVVLILYMLYFSFLNWRIWVIPALHGASSKKMSSLQAHLVQYAAPPPALLYTYMQLLLRVSALQN